MAGLLDTGQEIATYLLFHIIPILIYHIIYLVLPEDPMSFRILAKTIAKTSAWRLRGHPCNARPKQIKCFKKLKKKWLAKQFKTKQSSKSSPLTLCRHYLQPSRLVVASKKKSAISFAPFTGLHGSWHSKVLFLTIQRSDSTRTHFLSGSTTMHHDAWPTPPTSSLFEDLHLINNAGEVNGIGKGLAIKRKGTFMFSLEDDNGKNHTIKIPNSLYLPGLKQCLLSPQHWAQEAGDGKHGWGILSTSVCSIGTGEARKQSCSTQL